MSGPPQGGFNRGGAPPVAVQQTTVIQVTSPKSVVGAVLLGLFFGPLGLLYVTVPGALIMLGVSFVVAIFTLGLGLIIVGPICAIWGGIAASSHNNKQMQGVASHQAVGGAQSAPMGWYPDPEGGDRLRYYDGVRWTAQYAPQATQAEDAAADPVAEHPAAPQIEESAIDEAPLHEDEPEPEADDEADSSEAVTTIAPQQVFCGSCGNGISSSARFCPACGEAQATA